jgi:hypothetical protein
MLESFSNSCECERSSRNVILISEFQRCSEQCRVDAIVVLTELENEPNCLGLAIRVNTAIRFNFS